MYFLSMLGILVSVSIFWMSLCMLTVSKACEKSSATSTVRDGGGFWLKPVMMGSRMVCKAVVVECFVLKPC